VGVWRYRVWLSHEVISGQNLRMGWSLFTGLNGGDFMINRDVLCEWM
jgi:hypothetical protein